MTEYLNSDDGLPLTIIDAPCKSKYMWWNNPLPDGPYHGSRARRLFHNNLIKDLNGNQSKARALSVIDSYYSKYMKPGVC